MKNVYKMKDLDCANCAAKMERAISGINGVESANISFLAQKLTINAPEDQMEYILSEAVRLCKKIEPDCVIIY